MGQPLRRGLLWLARQHEELDGRADVAVLLAELRDGKGACGRGDAGASSASASPQRRRTHLVSNP